MNNNEEVKEKTQEKLVIEVKKRTIFKSIIGILILFVVLFFVYSIFFAKKRTVKTVISSMLTDQKVISQLSTLMIPYGGVYEEHDSEEKTKYIAYRGTVTYGIDFSTVNVECDEDEKIIIVQIPDVYLTNAFVEPSSLSSIPEGKVEDLMKRLSKCENDLKEKFNNKDDEMMKYAYDSARETLLNFLKPIVDAMDGEYKIWIE